MNKLDIKNTNITKEQFCMFTKSPGAKVLELDTESIKDCVDLLGRELFIAKFIKGDLEMRVVYQSKNSTNKMNFVKIAIDILGEDAFFDDVIYGNYGILFAILENDPHALYIATCFK